MAVRIVSFADRSVAIEYDIPEGQEIVDFLYRDLDERPDRKPHVTLTIGKQEDNQFTLHRAAVQLYHGRSKASLANILVGETLYHLTDKSENGMAIHAAALSRNSCGIILPGKSGAGKSSLTTWLLQSGYNYLTDELIFIRERSLDIEAFTRPINIKRRGMPAIGKRFDFSVHAKDTLISPHVAMIPHRLFKPDNKIEPSRLALILFPNHHEGAELELLRLSKAQAGLALMECLVNARNLNGHGFGEATRVAREVPAYRLTYSRFEQLAQSLPDILP